MGEGEGKKGEGTEGVKGKEGGGGYRRGEGKQGGGGGYRRGEGEGTEGVKGKGGGRGRGEGEGGNKDVALGKNFWHAVEMYKLSRHTLSLTDITNIFLS